MSKSNEEEQSNWHQVMKNFDLLFSQMSDLTIVQQQLKTQLDIRGAAMDEYTKEQHMIAQQVKANGAAVAQLTMKQFDIEENKSVKEDSISVIFDEEDQFENIFTRTRGNTKLKHLTQRNSLSEMTRRRLRRKSMFLIKLCLKCSFPNLMAPSQRSGKTSVKVILRSISCLRACGLQQQHYILKAMLPYGTRHTSRTTPSETRTTSVLWLIQNLEQMISEHQ